MSKLNWNLIAICAAIAISSIFFYLSVQSINATILQAATIQGDKVSPRNMPTEYNVNVHGALQAELGGALKADVDADVTTDGSLRLDNTKGSSFTVGMTLGRED